jgi:hypothetical protein
MNFAARLLDAASEGLRPNAERFLRFLGDGPVELQILGGKERFAENKYAHPADLQDAIKLFEIAEKQAPTGVYVLFNEPDDAVTTRSALGVWHAQKKGEATTDADIVSRRALFIDVDWARSKGTSTTDEHHAETIRTAEQIVDIIAELVDPTSIGIGDSGNGASVLIALSRIPDSPQLSALIREALYCLHFRFTDPRIQADKNIRNGIEIDTSVCDAKRLCPAYGTTKRKGAAGNRERPHRRTAFVCSDTPHRLNLAELEALVAGLRNGLDEDARAKLDKEFGRAPKPAPRPAASPQRPRSAPSRFPDTQVFRRANQVPVLDVLSWLGLLEHGDQPKCPGCGESDGSSVAIIGNGLKCLHNRCSKVGVKPGFRSVVDIVIDARKITAIEAVRELADRFGGFEVPEASRSRQPVQRIDHGPPPADPDAPLEPPPDFVEEHVPDDDGHVPVATPSSPDELPQDPEARPQRALAKVLDGLGAWVDELKVDKYGNPKPTYGNLCIVLRNVFGTRLSFDEMRGTPCIDGRPLGDADIGRVREELERKYALPMQEGNTIAGVRQIAEERRFHPVRDYLRALKWDGTLRLPNLANRILGTDEPLHARMMIAWFAQAAARAIRPGCKADAALVLVGPQGFYKSTFFSTLAGNFFSDTKMDISSRDGLMQLASAWIYEWSELENVTSRKQAAEVKAFITSQSDTFRPPFGKATVTHPRSSVIVGSTNEDQFLNDQTGSRRFWCIPVERRIAEESLRYLQSFRDQLWAEAVVNVDSNYQAYLTVEEEQRREFLAEAFQVTDAWFHPIAEWLETQEAARTCHQRGWLTVGDLLDCALGIDKARWDKNAEIRVGKVMRRLEWQHVRRRTKEGPIRWVYLPPPKAEQRQFEDQADDPHQRGAQTSWA